METIIATRQEIVSVHREGILARNIPPAGSTWWGALNSITAWSDHVQETESDRYAHVLLGSGDKLKATALAKIQTITGADHAWAR
jgi:hypothetical protein